MKLKGASGRREKARSEMREAIMNAARKLLQSEGEEGVSMRAIARELGYSPAAMYEYFASKEALTFALYCEGSDGLSGRMSLALSRLPDDAPGSDRLKTIGRSYRSFAKEQPELYMLTFGGRAIEHADKDGGDEPPALAILVTTIENAVTSGEFSPVSPEALAITCWSSVHGFVMLELSGFLAEANGDDPGAIDALFEASLSAIDLGLRRR